MKRTPVILIPLLWLVLASTSANAALSYWDSNGSTTGAGDTPTGTWDADTIWTSDPNGAGATNAWSDGDTAIFSAGTDATNAYTVTINSTVNPVGITFEEGVPTLVGGAINMTNAADFPIVCNTNAIISSSLVGSGFKKTGARTLTLSGNNGFGDVSTIAEGVVAITTGTALGSTLAATIVSNGATLQVATTAAQGEPAILNGQGVGGIGALRLTASNPGNNAWVGGVVLGSDARINMDVSGSWGWGTGFINGTNGGNNFNLYLGGTGIGTIRLNIGGRAIVLGSGSIYKDGNSAVTFETPCITGPLYFSGGVITVRASGGNPITATSTIYFNPGPGSTDMRTASGGPSFTLTTPIVINAGANAIFNTLGTSTVTNTINLNNVIGGTGNLTKTNTGPVNLNAANTYSGNTTVKLGNLNLGVNGSISNSAVIDVQSGATLDVSAVTGGFVLQTAQTLKGNGTVVGNVLVNGTISPGASVGNLTFNNNLTLRASASLLIEVDKSLSPSNDVITVSGTLTNIGGGTMTVANSGPSLVVGDSFQIFSQALLNGQALTVSSGGGVVWSNRLAVDGSIEVLTVPPKVPATNLTIVPLGSATFKLGGLGGPNLAYGVYTSTNIATPMTNWSLIGTTNADGSGVIQFVDPQATNKQRFYRFGQ
jgi:hypothetical protein